MTICVYCGNEKDQEALSDEHIWPAALGGDLLPDFWRTDDVCRTCNSIAGLYVDGEFIKGLPGIIERYGGIEFADPDNPSRIALALAYLGKLTNVSVENGQVAEYWAGPCGTNVIHIRPADKEEAWSTYAGGDPRRARQSGRVYIALTSENAFWVVASLRSVKAHFNSLRPIYIVNAAVPESLAPAFRQPDPSDEQQSRDLVTVHQVTKAGRNGDQLQLRMVIAKDVGTRFLAKVGLAIGYKVFGTPFLDTKYAKVLRQGFREANLQRRRKIPVRGVGYLGPEDSLTSLGPLLRCPGSWVLALLTVRTNLYLALVTPSGRVLGVVVSDDDALVRSGAKRFDEGVVWVVAPTLGYATGPIELPDYLAHQTGTHLNDELAALERKRVSRNHLPPC